MQNVNKEFLLSTLESILNTHSPSGYTANVMAYIKSLSETMGYTFEYNRKGGGQIHIHGEDSQKTVCISGHVDTLGAMVRSVDEAGNIEFAPVGGPLLPTLDGEYCTIFTRGGNKFRGTFLSKSPAAHVFDDAKTRSRDDKNMYIRLDADTKSKRDTLALGIAVGDFVCIDVKYEYVEGFVKSRFLDDKASVAAIMTVLKYLSENKIKPKYNALVLISNFEEVGHGASCIPPEIDEMLAVDMGCIGLDLSCTEHDVSICAKDSSGPYDYDMISKLIGFGKELKIGYAVDIYPFYSSDASAALRAGHNIKAALIGPGVHASHGMERTHISALEGTCKMVYKYLTTK